MFKITLFFLVLLFSFSGFAQIPQIYDIPNSFNPQQKELFTTRKTLLLDRKTKLKTRADELKVKCKDVLESNKKLNDECEGEQTQIKNERDELIVAINEFNNNIDHSGLELSDPTVVDGRKYPSGLPKSVDDAIVSGYAGAPTGVSDRVRKAFQAIAAHDWKVARAWFQDALNHDPTNAGLKRLVDLADYTEKFIEQKAATTSNTLKKPLTTEEIPVGADDKTYAVTSGKIHTHEAWEKFIKTRYPKPGQLRLPKDSDIEFLFPGLPAIQAQEMEDYMMEGLIKATLNDPQLIRASQPKPTNSKIHTILTNSNN